ncbi:hypothetical protein [Clostridium tyrobutyricum]|uniref:hypothetical protein n=1 Tax=Clostridium tyrobutyricum TaxID=1519 RepID=UPI00057F64C6|nr:hypothetical protein [Clostridium tyrobutyricum]
MAKYLKVGYQDPEYREKNKCRSQRRKNNFGQRNDNLTINDLIDDSNGLRRAVCKAYRKYRKEHEGR